MGYYSDIRISTSKAGYEKFLEYVSSNLDNDHFSDLFEDGDPDFYDEYKDSVIFGWDAIKWYEDYEDVSTVMEALEVLAKEYFFEYIRVGERRDDIERRKYGSIGSEYHRYLSTETKIVWW